MKYFFYSRTRGFEGGDKVKVYCVGGWEDGLTQKYEGLTGGDILKLTNVPKWLRSESKKI